MRKYQIVMKKIMTALLLLLFLASCGGTTNVDKVDEKGYNPAPEQIVESVCDQAVTEMPDSIAS